MSKNIFQFVRSRNFNHADATRLEFADFLLKVSHTNRIRIFGVCAIIRDIYRDAQKSKHNACGTLTMDELQDAVIRQLYKQLSNTTDLLNDIKIVKAIFKGENTDFDKFKEDSYFGQLFSDDVKNFDYKGWSRLIFDRLYISRVDGELSYFNGTEYISNSVETKNVIRKFMSFNDIGQRITEEVVSRISNMAMKVERVKVNDHGVDYVAVENGILRLDSNNHDVQFLPHTPEIVCMNALPITYDPKAKSETVDQVLMQWSVNDLALRNNLVETLGMCLTRRCYKKSVLLIGNSNGGKTVFLKRLFLNNIIGRDNAVTLSLNQSAERFSTIMLKNKQLMIADDIPEEVSDSNGQAVLKQVIDGAEIKAERKNEQPVIFSPYAKIIAASNFIPKFLDNALRRRFYVIPFDGDFTDQTVNEEIYSAQALSYWLNLMIEGFFRIEDHKSQGKPIFSFCERCERLNTEICDAGKTPIEKFIDDISGGDPEIAKDKLSWDFYHDVGKPNYISNVYQWYKNWSKANNEKVTDKSNFSRAIQRMFPDLVSMNHLHTERGARTNSRFLCRAELAQDVYINNFTGISRVNN
ncbi:MAG: phage/plasmid primase, P4 family [Succinatimonas hippei]|nr:phage/plasmid primase, P4 family [Succinatimonas hippei]